MTSPTSIYKQLLPGSVQNLRPEYLAMSSNGDRSQVTLQVQLAANRSKKAIETELDLTVDKFKLLLADLTGIPSHQQCLVYKGHTLENPQTLRSYGLFLFSSRYWLNFLKILGNIYRPLIFFAGLLEI